MNINYDHLNTIYANQLFFKEIDGNKKPTPETYYEYHVNFKEDDIVNYLSTIS